jgi:choline dehydrogenase-like flavoprotein
MFKIKSILLVTCLFSLLSGQFLEAKCHKRSSPSRADYVIVGVGTAGAVMAKRLTDDKKTSVIALQVGENLTEDPLIALSKNTAITVLYALIGFPLYENGETTPQPNADNRELEWAMAINLGGASSINGAAYVRASPELFSQWETIAGPNWSLARLLEVSKLIETYEGTTQNPAARGEHGPLTVQQDPIISTVSSKFTQAVVATCGVHQIDDYNDPLSPIGASLQMQYTHRGPEGLLRVSSANAFLNDEVMTFGGKGVNGRKLRVLLDSRALRTIWKGNKAVGVEYLSNGKIKKVYAKKGVIVCSGLKSSFFLLHSGVGPASLLESLNIPVVYDNPNVGQGLVDQPGVRSLFAIDPADNNVNPNSIFIQISNLPAPGGDPTVRRIRFAGITFHIPGIVVASLSLLQPLSRGSLTINSSDPLAPPVIDLGTFTNSSDLTLFQQGFQVYVKNIAEYLSTNFPGYELLFPDLATISDINLLTDFLKETVSCNEHFQSHCRMAPQDQGGVVDSNGFVYGVQNLIVADNSVVPMCMDGAPMSSAYLIAANIAQLLIDNNQ